MFRNVSKAVAVFSLSMVAGALFAATPAQLGCDYGGFMMKGLIHSSRIERFELIKDRKALVACQDQLSKCIVNTFELQKKKELTEFHQAALDSLQSMNLKNGSEVKGLSRNECARLSMVKFALIELHEKVLLGLARFQPEQQCSGDVGRICSELNPDAFWARAAANACAEVYGRYESSKVKSLLNGYRQAYLGRHNLRPGSFWYNVACFFQSIMARDYCCMEADEKANA